MARTKKVTSAELLASLAHYQTQVMVLSRFIMNQCRACEGERWQGYTFVGGPLTSSGKPRTPGGALLYIGDDGYPTLACDDTLDHEKTARLWRSCAQQNDRPWELESLQDAMEKAREHRDAWEKSA